MPGCVKPCSGPMTWTIPWRMSSNRKIGNAKFGSVSGKRLHLNARFLVRNARRPVSRRHIVISNSKCTVGCANRTTRGTQTFKSLRAGHFMNKVPVDIDQTGAIIPGDAQTCASHILSKRVLGRRHLFLQRSAGEGLPGRSERSGGRGPRGLWFFSAKYAPPYLYDHVDNTAWRDERDPGEQRKHRPPEDRKAGIHASTPSP